MGPVTVLWSAAAAVVVGVAQPPRGTAPPPPEEEAAAREEAAADGESVGPAGPRLRLELTPWIWALSIDGDVTIGERMVPVDADFVEVLENSDSVLGLAGRLELWYGRVGAFVDGAYARIGVDDIRTRPGTVDVETELAIVDFALQYRLVQAPGGDGAGRGLTLDVYVGGRYTDIGLTIDPDNADRRRDDEAWVDPIVGAALEVPLAERWRLHVNGDVGGFGAASDFAWSATALVGYDFRLFDLPATVYGGYRGVGADFEEGRFGWDAVVHGPILGLTVRF